MPLRVRTFKAAMSSLPRHVLLEPVTMSSSMGMGHTSLRFVAVTGVTLSMITLTVGGAYYRTSSAWQVAWNSLPGSNTQYRVDLYSDRDTCWNVEILTRVSSSELVIMASRLTAPLTMLPHSKQRLRMPSLCALSASMRGYTKFFLESTSRANLS